MHAGDLMAMITYFLWVQLITRACPSLWEGFPSKELRGVTHLEKLEGRMLPSLEEFHSLKCLVNLFKCNRIEFG